MKKTFNTIKSGDKIYISNIKDSQIIQDCAGNIILEYYVDDISETSDFYTLKLTVENMKPKSYGVFEKIDIPIKEIISVNRNLSLQDDDLFSETPDKYELKINKRIISTSKFETAKKLVEIGNNFKDKINEIKNALSKASLKQETLSLTAGFSIKHIKPEEEKNYTLEEVASMAM